MEQNPAHRELLGMAKAGDSMQFVGAQVGLGYLIVALNFSLDVPGVFAVLIVLSAIGLAMHGAMRFAARRYIFWIRRSEAPRNILRWY